MDSSRIELHSETVDFELVYDHCSYLACNLDQAIYLHCHLSVENRQPRQMKEELSLAATLAQVEEPRSTKMCFEQRSKCVQVREELRLARQPGFAAGTKLTIPLEDLSTNSTLNLSLE